VAGVQVSLAHPVGARVGHDLGRQGGSTLEVGLGDEAEIVVGDEDQVGLHHRVVGEDDVVGSDEHTTAAGSRKVVGEGQEKASEYVLVAGVGCRGDNHPSIDEFPPHEIVKAGRRSRRR
jgi:hypothetical protein